MPDPRPEAPAADRTRFIVYGTLRRGASAEQLWAGRAVAEPAALHGYRLYDTGLGFPIVRPEPGATCVVDVLTPTDEHVAAALLHALDVYEEVPRDYERVVVTATLTTGDEVRGWLYVGIDTAFATRTPVPSGNWLTHPH